MSYIWGVARPRKTVRRTVRKTVRRAAPTRREAADATRDAILDAAEALLGEGGPAAVRLQEIAARVGVAHPTLLYHFRSRDGLLAALFQRSSRRMRQELLDEVLRPLPPGAALDPAALLGRVYERVTDPRRAPILAWLLACGEEPFGPGGDADDDGASLAEIAARMHALRVAADPGAADDDEGTRFGLMTLTLLMFGDLLLGGATRRRLGLRDDAATRARYRRWLAARLPAAIAALPDPHP